ARRGFLAMQHCGTLSHRLDRGALRRVRELAGHAALATRRRGLAARQLGPARRRDRLVVVRDAALEGAPVVAGTGTIRTTLRLDHALHGTPRHPAGRREPGERIRGGDHGPRAHVAYFLPASELNLLLARASGLPRIRDAGRDGRGALEPALPT